MQFCLNLWTAPTITRYSCYQYCYRYKINIEQAYTPFGVAICYVIIIYFKAWTKIREQFNLNEYYLEHLAVRLDKVKGPLMIYSFVINIGQKNLSGHFYGRHWQQARKCQLTKVCFSKIIALHQSEVPFSLCWDSVLPHFLACLTLWGKLLSFCFSRFRLS